MSEDGWTAYCDECGKPFNSNDAVKVPYQEYPGAAFSDELVSPCCGAGYNDRPKEGVSKTCKCPECGKEIDHLVNVESGDKDYRFNPDGSYEAGEFLSDGGKNEYECPDCQETLFTNETDALEFLQGAKDNTTPAIDTERPITDEVATAIAKEAEEYHKRKEQEANEAPITIYWRKEQDEKLNYEGMRDFDAAEWKRDELIKAGYIDIQIIVKGKKKEVIRK